jgi:hypothetical protein
MEGLGSWPPGNPDFLPNERSKPGVSWGCFTFNVCAAHRFGPHIRPNPPTVSGAFLVQMPEEVAKEGPVPAVGPLEEATVQYQASIYPEHAITASMEWKSIQTTETTSGTSSNDQITETTNGTNSNGQDIQDCLLSPIETTESTSLLISNLQDVDSPVKLENCPLAKGRKTRPSKIQKTPIQPQRRSQRLLEKDAEESGNRSPGRRCEPHHRGSSPGKSVLKNGNGNDSFDSPRDNSSSVGFYSAQDLERFIEQSELAPSSPVSLELYHIRASTRKRHHKKVVAWSAQLEW